MTYSVRILNNSDSGLLEAFLLPHTAEAFYIRSNSIKSGLEYSGEYLHAEYFGAFRGTEIVGVLAYSWIDTLLIFASDEGCVPALARAAIPSIEKRKGKVDALLGIATQGDALISELEIPPEAFRKNETDWLFRAKISEMPLPELRAGFSVRVAEERDFELLVKWRVAFNIEATNATAGEDLEKKVREEIRLRLPMRDLFILEREGHPVSYCGAGGHVPDTVMIGPVWTPPELRCKGYARAVVAHGLCLAANSRPALQDAVLFASKPDAIKAYEAIGFSRIADWRLGMLKADYRVRKTNA